MLEVVVQAIRGIGVSSLRPLEQLSPEDSSYHVVKTLKQFWRNGRGEGLLPAATRELKPPANGYKNQNFY